MRPRAMVRREPGGFSAGLYLRLPTLYTYAMVPHPNSRRAPLSTERVVNAALEIIDAEGADALSMRKLAQSLDREVMALYRYAKNKAALLDGVIELVLGEFTIDPNAEDWANELRQLSREFRRVALAHPHVVPLMVTRPLVVPMGLRPPGTLRPLEDFLQLLVNVGFTASDALHAYRLFFAFLHGHVLDELQQVIVDPAEHEAVLRLGLQNLPLSQFSQLRTLGPELERYDGAMDLEQGVDMMITGLQTHFRPVSPGAGPAAAG